MRLTKNRYHHAKTKKRASRIPIFIVMFLVVMSIISYQYMTLHKNVQNELSVVMDSENTEEKIVTQSLYNFDSIVFSPEGQSAVGTLEFGVIKSSSANEKPIPMASITKLITVLSVLEKAPLEPGQQGDIITLNAKDEQYWHDYVALQGTITPVTAGYTMTQYEALQAILLPSSNNIADTLVDRYFDSREEYLYFANSLIKSYGLKNTKVSDASGFSPESVSTPSDLIIIGQKILNKPVLAQIVAQQNANISVAGEIPNYNPLITIPGVTGIKPGATDEAGYCLLFSADTINSGGKKETIIGVVMGIKDRPTYQSSALRLLEDSTAIIQQG